MPDRGARVCSESCSADCSVNAKCLVRGVVLLGPAYGSTPRHHPYEQRPDPTVQYLPDDSGLPLVLVAPVEAAARDAAPSGLLSVDITYVTEQSRTTSFPIHGMAQGATGCWSSVTKSCEESVRYSAGVSSEGSAPNRR